MFGRENIEQKKEIQQGFNPTLISGQYEPETVGPYRDAAVNLTLHYKEFQSGQTYVNGWGRHFTVSEGYVGLVVNCPVKKNQEYWDEVKVLQKADQHG